MERHLLQVEQVSALIRGGQVLLLAGEENLLRRLPRGSWIGGTIPYFMADSGGCVDRQRVFVTALPAGLTCRAIRRYGAKEIQRVYADLPADGFGVVIAPAQSQVHLAFALDAPGYEKFAPRPLVGWISGVHLSELGKTSPKVIDGTTGEALDQAAVVMHLGLPPRKVAELGILNIFGQGDGPAISFPESGFSATSVEIDGRRCNLAQYVREMGLDTRLPLVADYCGTSINVSFQTVAEARGEVRFYAPVFAGIRYRHARPVGDYVAEFTSGLPRGIDGRVAFSCNCILNYLHSGLEGRSTGGIVGPITFGEIAYQLLNQTMVYVTIEDAAR